MLNIDLSSTISFLPHSVFTKTLLKLFSLPIELLPVKSKYMKHQVGVTTITNYEAKQSEISENYFSDFNISEINSSEFVDKAVSEITLLLSEIVKRNS